MFDKLIQDVRNAARSARTNLGLTTIAVLTLGLGTGANIAIFQLVDVVRLRMLPVESPEALVELSVDDMTHARGTWLRTPSLTYRLWEEVREHSEPFSGVFAWADETLDIASAGPARRVNGLWVSGEFFQVLGVKPLVGRLFTLADDHRNCGLAPGAVISHRFWQREFGGDPSVIGKPVVFGKHRLDVIGVTPQEFFGVEVGRQFDIAMPLCASSTWFEAKGRIDSGNLWWLTVMARLKPAFTAEQAATYLEIESPKIFRATLPPGYPAASVKPYLGMKLMPTAAQHGTSRLRERYSTPLLVLLALTGLMLLVACGNLAHLMLARLASRRRELSVRVALGASRARLIQLLGVENGLVATAGVTTGLLLSLFISRFLVDLLSTDRVPIGLDLSLDHRTFAFAAFLNVVTCAAFATVPVLRAARSRATVDERLHQRNGVAIKARTRRVLLVSQIAVSLILLSGAFLFARTLRNLHTLDPGFERDGTVIVDVTFSDSQQPSERNAQLRREFLEQVLSLQPVKSVAEVLIVPLTAGNWNNRVWLDGSDPDQPQVVYRNMVAPGYFRTLNTSVVAGREFTDADTDTSSPRSAIVNEAFIASLGLGDNVVSRAFWVEATAFEPRTRYEIVGVVKNTKYRDLREPFRPTVFVPLSRAALARANGQFVMRSSASPQALSASLAAAVSRTKTAIRYSMRTIDSLEEESLGRERLMVATSVPIALFAVVLAGIGLYGVTSYAIAQRRNEIGVRIALGATQGQVRGLILQEAAAVALVGIVAGTLLTMAIGRSIGTLFYEVPPHDPLSLSATALLLAGVAGLAAYLPARRAARMDPVASLRGDW